MITDPTGRGPSLRRLTISGATTLAVIAATLYLLALRYTGAFVDSVPVTAVVTSIGDGLPEHADVKFRGLLVGTVSGVDIAARGETQHIHIDLEPTRAAGIPNTITARVVPNNLFGVTAVELVDNGKATHGLTAGATIGEDPQGATQLQTTLTALRTVLDHIQPERLGRLLGTLADALKPEYRAPGSTIDRLDHWITTVDAIPGIGDFLGNLGRAAASVDQSTPDLIDALNASIRTAQTAAQRRAEVVAMLSAAGGMVDTTNTLFARNRNAGMDVVVGLDDMLGALAGDPGALTGAIDNFDTALGRLATVFHWGPKNEMSWSMTVTFTPFQQYTAADCPHYDTLYGPRCGGPTVPIAAPRQDVPPQLTPHWLDAAGPRPAELRGPAAVQQLVGGQPNAAQLLLLGSALTGGSVATSTGGTR